MTRLNVKAGDAVILHPDTGTPMTATVQRVSGQIVYVAVGNAVFSFYRNGRRRGGRLGSTARIEARDALRSEA
jgi:hypothetical protein